MPSIKIDPDGLREGSKVVVEAGDEKWGEYDVVSLLPEKWQVPDSGGEQIYFPAEVADKKVIVSYSGTLPRGPAMFVLHKAGCPIVPLTDDLKKMVEAFDRHDEMGVDWMVDELGIAATLGKDCAAIYEKVKKKFPGYKAKDLFAFLRSRYEEGA